MKDTLNLDKRYKLIFFAQTSNLIGWSFFFTLFTLLFNFIVPESFFPENYIQDNAAASFFPLFAIFLVPDILTDFFMFLGFLSIVFSLYAGLSFAWVVLSTKIILKAYKKSIIKNSLKNTDTSVEELKLFKKKLSDFSIGMLFIFITLLFISMLVLTKSIILTMIFSPSLFSFYLVHKKICQTELLLNK